MRVVLPDDGRVIFFRSDYKYIIFSGYCQIVMHRCTMRNALQCISNANCGSGSWHHARINKGRPLRMPLTK